MSRVVAILAVAVAVLGAAIVLFGAGGGGYEVKLRFQNAGQLVTGDEVRVYGVKAGSVERIGLAPNGEAEVTVEIDDDYAPLRRGTHATVRSPGLAGVANRYVELRLAPDSAQEVPDGGVLDASDTTSIVDADAVLGAFDPVTRRALASAVRGLSGMYRGRGDEIRDAIPYVNPMLAGSGRLLAELNRDEARLARLIESSARLTGDVAARRRNVAGLVDHLATTMSALDRHRPELVESVAMLPDFLRRANTTQVNLRAALDDVEPLVRDARPAARRLRPLLAELRPLAKDARPTVADLARIARRPGRGNDLIDFMRATPPLRDIAIGPVERNGKRRAGTLDASARALIEAAKIVGFARPYMPDFTGFLDNYGHAAVYDALGSIARSGQHYAAFVVQGPFLNPVPPELREQAFRAVATTGQTNRCPGSVERDPGDGSTPYRPTPSFECDPTQVPPGP